MWSAAAGHLVVMGGGGGCRQQRPVSVDFKLKGLGGSADVADALPKRLN